MKESIRSRLERLNERFEELAGMLADPQVIREQARFRELSQEYARLEPVMADFRAWRRTHEELQTARELAGGADRELRALGEDEVRTLSERLANLERSLDQHMLAKDPHDERNVFLEIRAGTGGHEAALFAGDLFRMYSRYAESQGWRVEVLSDSPGEHGGYRELIARIVGRGVYSRLKFESGAHRVQRVPLTEAQGRIHTSACTVAVLPEVEEIDEVEVNPADLRIDTYRASGAGGQHVNKTDSAVRITHLPSGIVVECQDERSQHKNRARAMSLLKSRLLSAVQERRQTETAEKRKLLVGSGDRSERIRTYNFPQSRVTDHRINLTLYKLDQIIEGDLGEIIEALSREHQAQALAEVDSR